MRRLASGWRGRGRGGGILAQIVVGLCHSKVQMGALEQVEHEIAGLHSMLKLQMWRALRSRLKHEMGGGGLWS